MLRSYQYDTSPANYIMAGRWIMAQAGEGGDIERGGIVFTIERDDRLLGAVAYHNWSAAKGMVEVSLAFDSNINWPAMQELREAFEYPWQELEVGVIFGRCSATNSASQRLMRAAGFGLVLVPHGNGIEGDAFMGTLTHDMWLDSPFVRFWNRRSRTHGQRSA